jgi:hypothetical protein
MYTLIIKIIILKYFVILMASTYQYDDTTLNALSYSLYATTPTTRDAFSNDNSNNIIFEFTALNIVNQFSTLPLFEKFQIEGFPNVSAIALYKVNPTTLNELFYFEGNNLSTGTITPFYYGINMSHRFNYSYSNASLTYGAINTNGIPIVKADYVNYLAYAITGGYNLADIFDNQQGLLNEVVSMDGRFNNIINATISNLSSSVTTPGVTKIIDINNGSVFFDTEPEDGLNRSRNSSYIDSCRTLVNGLLSITNTPRGMKFLQDIEDQNTSAINAVPSNPNASSNASTVLTSYYYVRFHEGDILSLVLNYVPYSGNGEPIIGSNPVYTRPYKIMLLCDNNVE